MEAFDVIILCICFFVLVISFWNIISPKSPYNTMKKEQNEHKEIEHINLQAKIEEAQEHSKEAFNLQQKQVEANKIQLEKVLVNEFVDKPSVVYKGRKPSLDSFGRAIEGVGVEFKIVGMKYRSVEEQTQAMCLEPGDSVLLKPEINQFSGSEAMAVYTTTKILVGYVATEQSRRAKDMMFREYLQAFVKIPWNFNKSWFLVVVPEEN